MYPFLTKRVITIPERDFETLLHNKDPLFDTLSTHAREQLWRTSTRTLQVFSSHKNLSLSDPLSFSLSSVHLSCIVSQRKAV